MAKKKSTRKKTKKKIETLTHDEAKRSNIPTAEFQSVMAKDAQKPVRVAYGRGAGGLEEEKAERNRDLDPQLVWRGKDEQDWSDLVVQAPPLFIQEKVHPKVLVDDLRRRSEAAEIARKLASAEPGTVLEQFDLFADFNGIADLDAKTEFYQHDANWTNRMILGDSLQVMASLAEREGLRGKVQCIYLDPPYGIKFNSNFQWSTTSRDVKDGKVDHITREPEQVKAFRDTWRDGIHSYLTYLRDRLTVCRDLLTESGSIFVQIGDENVHRIRALMDEVFGENNFTALIAFRKVSGLVSKGLPQLADYAVWYSKNSEKQKVRQLFNNRTIFDDAAAEYRYVELPDGEVVSGNITKIRQEYGDRKDVRFLRPGPLTSQDATESGTINYDYRGEIYNPSKTRHWSVNAPVGLDVLGRADRLMPRKNSLSSKLYLEDNPGQLLSNTWMDTSWGFETQKDKVYVVQTHPLVAQRCILMCTDPGDLVLDPTCGAGTTAYVAEQWGRRWITIDTSRVALALARTRIMGARYPFYLLSDSKEGQKKEAEVTRSEPSELPAHGNIRQGFVYKRVPHITLKSIANNTEIDVIWEKYQNRLEPLREQLNKALGRHAREGGQPEDDRKKMGSRLRGNDGNTPWEEWEIPREAGDPWDDDTAGLFFELKAELARGEARQQRKVDNLLAGINQNLGRALTVEALPDRSADPWPAKATDLHSQWWEQRIVRQKEIDASIAAKADYEYLYDKPYVDNKKVRVAGPFTVESISPHRVLGVDADDELIDPNAALTRTNEETDFAQMIMENLKTAGVQQAHKEDKITFSSIAPWPGYYICAEGRYVEDDSEGKENRAGIFIGPEFGTVTRQDLVLAAREAGDADFDVLIACAFNYEAHASEFDKLGRIPVLKARMNADLHMADDLKNTGKGNLFVIFGEPDIDILPPEDAPEDADIKEYSTIRVRINGVDVFHPQTGEIRSDGAEGIACWFIDTDYNEESFFVRQAYFLGANDPYKSLKTTLKAEINKEAWATLHSDVSRPFEKPEGGRIAVKVINHLGDEVMKVFRVE